MITVCNLWKSEPLISLHLLCREVLMKNISEQELLGKVRTLFWQQKDLVAPVCS